MAGVPVCMGAYLAGTPLHRPPGTSLGSFWSQTNPHIPFGRGGRRAALVIIVDNLKTKSATARDAQYHPLQRRGGMWRDIEMTLTKYSKSVKAGCMRDQTPQR
jgi:hypothetical protein